MEQKLAIENSYLIFIFEFVYFFNRNLNADFMLQLLDNVNLRTNINENGYVKMDYRVEYILAIHVYDL